MQRYDDTMRLWDVLARLGHQPVREVRGEKWYLSPFRQETEASFKLNRDGHAWYDHGRGEGGHVIDFAMAWFQTDWQGAQRELAQLQGTIADESPAWMPSPSPAPSKPEAGTEPALTVTKIQPISSQALKHYLRQRGIALDVATPYLQELHYLRNDKPYFALAFANESGGYELRNPYFKGSHGTKDITVIQPGTEAQQSVAVFEGFMDFLSAMVVAGRAPQMPVIVMNSVAMKQRTVQTIQEIGAQTAYLYLDHDETGRRLTAELQQMLADVEVLDRAALYRGHKDLNDYLVNRGRQQAAWRGRKPTALQYRGISCT